MISISLSFPNGPRGAVILSERAARARAKDLLWCGAHEKQVLRACGAQDDRRPRFAERK